MKGESNLRKLGLAAIVAVLCALIPTVVFAEEWKLAYRTLLGSPLYDVAFMENRTRFATADGIITLDAEGKEINRHLVDTATCYMILAENGRYGVVQHRPRVPQFPEMITLFNERETVASFPIAGTPYLAPNGDWLLTTNRYSKTVAVYDGQGNLLREDTYPQVQGASISFADNDQRVLINFPLGPTRGITVLYDRSGRRLFKVENQFGYANAVLAARGNRAAVIGRARVAIYDETGNVQQIIGRGNRSGLGMMTKDGRELWLAEGEGLRIVSINNDDSRTIALDADKGDVVKLADEPSGQHILVGQKIEQRESGVVWMWRVLDRVTGGELWRGEERQQVGYATLGSETLLKGSDEIEGWTTE